MYYEKLLVWQKSMDLVESIYKITSTFPNTENFALSSQLQRAAISIPSNIAEGHGRKMTRVYLRHLSIAYGSLMEVETQLKIARRLNYIDHSTLNVNLPLTTEIGKMLCGLIKNLKTNLDQQKNN